LTHVTGNGANNLSSIKSLIDDSPNELVMEDTAEVFMDDAASLLTSATQRSRARKKKFQEEFTWLKAEHQAKMEAHQKAQQEDQDRQEAQLAALLKTMQDLQWQMSALQAKQQPSASSGAADAPREE
jgi:myosin heavy subunit